MPAEGINIQEKIKEEYVKCATDPVYFMKKYYMIQHPQRGRQMFDLYPFQEKVLKLFQKYPDSVINKSRQLGISTLVSAYSLWLMMFQRDKNVLVIATKQDTAKNIVTKVRFAYDNLPEWMRKITKSVSNNQLSLKLTNGSQIKAVSAAGDSGRSEAVSLLVIDEAAFIDNIETIYTAAKMTLATGGGCIALSTPNGVGNWFHNTYTKAQKQENNFLPISLPWTVHPERDIEWRKQQDVDLGVRMAAQECDCDFATSGNTVIEPEILTWYADNCIKEPLNREGLDRALWVWEYPDPMRYYMVVADVARGDGMDYSAYHVIDVDTLTQVAEYKAQVDTRYFANELISIATKYNRALLVIENANIGWDVIQSVLESGYNNMHYSHRADNSADFQTYLSVHNGNNMLVPGFTMATKIRLNVIEKMRDFVENKQVVFRSIRLLDELRVFIWKNGKQQAMQGYNDDLVMSFAIAMFLRETSVRYKKAADSLTVSVMNNIGKSSSDMGFYNSNSTNAQNPWNMNVSAPGGDYVQDLTWLLG
jgi:Terminase large subunit, T4likevirus-type, N-terminal